MIKYLSKASTLTWANWLIIGCPNATRVQTTRHGCGHKHGWYSFSTRYNSCRQLPNASIVEIPITLKVR